MLQDNIASFLEGSGLRSTVLYNAPVYDETQIPRRLKSPESFDIAVINPLEWKVTLNITGDDIGLPKALEFVNAVKKFDAEVWPDRVCSELQYEVFRKIPGRFEWLSEKTPDILYRITMMKLTQKFGVRNIRSIDLYEDELIVHTRTGPFLIGYDNYRDRMDEVMRTMGAFMRKPIRYRYLLTLRQQKKQQDINDTDKTKG